MNGEHVKVRGFCDHESWGGVGMAVPDRVALFRAQASRSVGGNGRRSSHNPAHPVILDVRTIQSPLLPLACCTWTECCCILTRLCFTDL